ncbi:MAG: Rrf2 family transcriptional regulator [Ignavibacteriaceae bacterium]|nr:Rrf2 family transcriptional regulator [Ignavibacteriaceae bacterium]NUM71777.1 Rrf2 family transcriptional regulator [Ignavibacteriaceae bacterium]
MKFSAQEEYGLRCLLRIAKADSENGLTIPEISALEGLSQANTAKILRILRLGGFIESERGQLGGYKLRMKPEEIIISDVLNQLGGKLFDNSFCTDYSGTENICTHDINCSVRSLWRIIQNVLDSVLSRTTLRDLTGSENHVSDFLQNLSEEAISDFSRLKSDTLNFSHELKSRLNN